MATRKQQQAAAMARFQAAIAQPAELDSPQLHQTIAAHAARDIHLKAAQLADTVPPVEPPAQLPAALPVAHQLVRWHRSPVRVTKLAFETLEAARAAAAELAAEIFYRYAIMRGREEIEARDLPAPAFSFWSPGVEHAR